MVLCFSELNRIRTLEEEQATWARDDAKARYNIFFKITSLTRTQHKRPPKEIMTMLASRAMGDNFLDLVYYYSVQSFKLWLSVLLVRVGGYKCIK